MGEEILYLFLLLWHHNVVKVPMLRIALVVSFFLPVACEVRNALAAPAHPCGKTTHSDSSPGRDLPCCLSAYLDRAAVRDAQGSPHVELAAIPAMLTAGPLLDVSCPSTTAFRAVDAPEHAPPPRELYLLKASFLI